MKSLSFAIARRRSVYENTVSTLTSTLPIYMRTDMAVTPIVLTLSTTTKLSMYVPMPQGVTTSYTNMQLKRIIRLFETWMVPKFSSHTVLLSSHTRNTIRLSFHVLMKRPGNTCRKTLNR